MIARPWGPNAAEVQQATLMLVGALFGQVLTVDETVQKITHGGPV
jgi:hypothetical protein